MNAKYLRYAVQWGEPKEEKQTWWEEKKKKADPTTVYH